jgi:dTDP-4-dehydrorhamnose 3,5-epimerase-like enzyme
VQRIGRGLAAAFPPETTQTRRGDSITPAPIKAFHYHLHQTDCWTPAMGLLQVALVDLRVGSPTFGVRNTIYAGPMRPWQIADSAGSGAWLQSDRQCDAPC